ncbi:MAG: TIGR02466 family protein [Steroidobacteraceae bacterium]
MPLQTLFPTHVYTAPLGGRVAALNRRLLRECAQLRLEDRAGRAWSAEHYTGGYTSYNSRSRMHQVSPTFANLARHLDRHVREFARALDFDLRGRALAMTDCWVNVMRRQGTHSPHLHPLSTVSGTYYVSTPSGCAGIKFEDPRLERFMAAPPRKAQARAANRAWQTLPARAGRLVLFESWLRHEVPSTRSSGERISISFNYGWF